MFSIMMRNADFIFAWYLGFPSLGLKWASAQLLPALPQLPSADHADKPATTKLVRIYNGTGYFDDALAAKVRPIVVTGGAPPNA